MSEHVHVGAGVRADLPEVIVVQTLASGPHVVRKEQIVRAGEEAGVLKGELPDGTRTSQEKSRVGR